MLLSIHNFQKRWGHQTPKYHPISGWYRPTPGKRSAQHTINIEKCHAHAMTPQIKNGINEDSKSEKCHAPAMTPQNQKWFQNWRSATPMLWHPKTKNDYKNEEEPRPMLWHLKNKIAIHENSTIKKWHAHAMTPQKQEWYQWEFSNEEVPRLCYDTSKPRML